MIPASYLFKDMYRQHWEAPDAPVVEKTNRLTGLMKPLRAAVLALLGHRTRARDRRFGGHAYE